MREVYDLIVIGSGSGGYIAAIEAAKLQKNTAVIENRQLGGTCLNRGCIPTKTLMHTAGLMQEIRVARQTGLQSDGVTLDFDALSQRKEDVVSQLRDGIAFLFKKHKIDFVNGNAMIQAPGEVRVTTQKGETTLFTKHILIATGAEPVVPPIPGIAQEGVITSDELLAQTNKRFDRLVIIGGGVIGMEFASIYSAFGSRVTVIEAQERILATLDKEIAQNLKMILKKRGVDILTDARVLRFESSPAGKPLCVFMTGGEEKTLEADGVLVAVGRKAQTKGLFAGALDLAFAGNGCIAVDENMQTALPGIWAIGDVTGGVQLAHAAAAQGRRAVAAMFGEKCTLRTDLIPVCVYTDPEIACVGMDADEAKSAGLQVKTRKITMNSNGKSLLSLQERGFIKTVEDAQTGILLGAQMMCARATDMISEFSLAIANNMTSEQLGQIIRPHPTFNEAVGELFEK